MVIGFTSQSPSKTIMTQYSDLAKHGDISVLINLIGGHSRNYPLSDFSRIEELDDIGCTWSVSHDKPYIYLSSGSVFGTNLSSPIMSDCVPKFRSDLDHYAQSKIIAEQKHADLRSRGGKIHDLRIFSFAGPRFIKSGNYFLSALVDAVKNQALFRVIGTDFVRDYIGSKELAQAVSSCIASNVGLTSNLHSSEPTTRSQILEFFIEDLNLRCEFGARNLAEAEFTELYYSSPSELLQGYLPRRSLDVIRESVLEVI